LSCRGEGTVVSVEELLGKREIRKLGVKSESKGPEGEWGSVKIE